MLKTFVFLSFFYFLVLPGRAQNTGFAITGTVTDSATSGAVELATIALRLPNGTTVINATTADASGKFELKDTHAGKYQLAVAFMGYNTRIIPVTINSNLNLGNIQLSPSVNSLKAAVITAERPDITINAEKTVFNVAKSPSSQTGMADDLLRNIPGITVDQDGNISITGKQGVKVLVDGKPNAQADNDLPGFLKSLPANSIESIEVINNPSARYDAEGNAGIINIKLKKGKANGLNVSLSAAYGILNRYNGNININYRKDKFNVFANYAVNDSKTGFTSVSNRDLLVNDTTSYYNYTGTGQQKRLGTNLKAGFDYNINDQNTITYTASGNYGRSN